MRLSTAAGWYLFSIMRIALPLCGLKSPPRPECQRASLNNVSASITSSASPPRKTPIRSIILLAVAGFAAQAQVRVTDSLLPQIAADFQTTVGAAAVVVTAYAVAHGSIQLVIGPIGDKLGKYRTVAMMCAIGTVLVALCGIAASLHQIALARLATGAAAGWIIPISMAYVGDGIGRHHDGCGANRGVEVGRDLRQQRIGDAHLRLCREARDREQHDRAGRSRPRQGCGSWQRIWHVGLAGGLRSATLTVRCGAGFLARQSAKAKR